MQGKWMATWLMLASPAVAAPELADLASGEDTDRPWIDPDADVARVVGGVEAEEGAWPDVAGIVFQNAYVGCTGTLITPTLVLTAGHCAGGITHVILDSTNWFGDEGEMIPVARTIEHPNSWATYDAAVLVLEYPSEVRPRQIAMDCILDQYLEDGARVGVVGYGNTEPTGNGNTSILHEGYTYVQDADCSEDTVEGVWSGCNDSVSPGGEIGAGGNEVDACFGDSGGPLFLMTPKGPFLVGITSRSYAGVPAQYPCRDGGIYVRPDAIIDWVEEQTGQVVPRPLCNEPPVGAVDPIVVAKNGKKTTTLETFDPEGEVLELSVAVDPSHGTLTLEGDGTVTYEPDQGYVGDDEFVLTVADPGNPAYPDSPGIAVDVRVPVKVRRRVCGCASGGEAPGGLALLLLAGLVRRKRR